MSLSRGVPWRALVPGLLPQGLAAAGHGAALPNAVEPVWTGLGIRINQNYSGVKYLCVYFFIKLLVFDMTKAIAKKVYLFT